MKNFVIDKYRVKKAKKIDSVLSDFLGQEIKNKVILDIGTGNGEIAEYFSKNNKVISVDTIDQRKNKKSKVLFNKVKSEKLPFEDNTFDIIISNHVIEHVLDGEKHIQEIKRVLKKNGICYLATPNRIFPWETHYKVLFIHYLPKIWFNKILKLFNKFKGDIYLLDYFSLKKLISKNFKINEYTHKIIKNPNKYHFNVFLIDRLPIYLIEKLNFISKINIFILENEKKDI